uniref:Lipocalin/cytosolic fatty-acid binding domain-containing protein n=2 Tax=Leptobrachium leishanense TaxID=445787 RepID=A0A8C5LWJ5_9ANUR
MDLSILDSSRFRNPDRMRGMRGRRHGRAATKQRLLECILRDLAQPFAEDPSRASERMKQYKYVFVAILLAIVEQINAQSCVVDSFKVKEDFDIQRYGGKWYAIGKKDPEGLFLQDNISADHLVDEDGKMTASSKGRVKLFGFWLICAEMAAQYTVPDSSVPSKMYMAYQGLASYLSSGGDNYWVIDTDYDNYAITYACRTLKEDGTCDDGYSIIFSRNPRGFSQAIQKIVRQKQEEICLAGQYQPVLQTGAC